MADQEVEEEMVKRDYEAAEILGMFSLLQDPEACVTVQQGAMGRASLCHHGRERRVL